MSGEKNIKNYLFQKKKELERFLSGISRSYKRLVSGSGTLKYEDSFKVPIIINSYNRYETLLQLTEWLRKSGYNHIIILDNNSTYQPLIDYYTSCPHKVIYLKKNVGYKALWDTDVFNKYKSGFYVYTDPDVLPGINCPRDIVFKLYQVLERHKQIEKCGVALKIDDLPNHYENKNEVINWEKKHWSKLVEENVYDAPVDTTFALYRPFAQGEAEVCKGYRLAGDCCFLHMPWYINSSELTDEEMYYRKNAAKGQSHWIEQA